MRAPSSSPASSGAARRSHRGQTRTRRSRRAQERAKNRRLRSLVKRYKGCLSSLDSRSRRLLSLRAGLHGSPRSARAVARILHVSAGRERLLERMSLLALQTAAAGGCGRSSATTPVPGAGTAQLTPTAPWLTTVPVSIPSGSPSTGSPSSRQHVRASGGRSVKPAVITPGATRTAEPASTGDGPASPAEIVLLAILALAVACVLVPGVRRRLLPTLAGPSAADGDFGPAGDGIVSAAASTVRPPTSRQAPPPPGAAPSPSVAETPEAHAAPEIRVIPAVAQSPGVDAAFSVRLAPPPPAIAPHQISTPPGTAPQVRSQRSQPVHGQNQPRLSWFRGHATQGALMATVLAGGLLRILKRGRGR